MDKLDLHQLSSEEIEQKIDKSSPKELQKFLPLLSLEGMTHAFQYLSHSNTKTNQEKALASIQPLRDHGQLEAAGRGLSAPLFLHLVQESEKESDPSFSSKINALLVGLLPENFIQLLELTPLSQLHPLKKEGLAEPLQHHLVLFAHQVEKQNEQILNRFFELHRDIEEMRLEEITSEGLKELKEQIHQLALYYQSIINSLDKALALAWNTNRPDVIDQLTTLKENSLRQNLLGVGEGSDRIHAPYSLHTALKTHLDSIFGDLDDPGDMEALHNSDAAIEGLTKLSLWYLSDYVSVGILPHLPVEEHELGENTREEYYSQAQKNLERYGLATVGDLKEKGIFSKKMLKEYLSKDRLKQK